MAPVCYELLPACRRLMAEVSQMPLLSVAGPHFFVHLRQELAICAFQRRSPADFWGPATVAINKKEHSPIKENAPCKMPFLKGPVIIISQR